MNIRKNKFYQHNFNINGDNIPIYCGKNDKIQTILWITSKIYQKQREKILTHPAAYYIIRNCDMQENTTPMPRWEYLI